MVFCLLCLVFGVLVSEYYFIDLQIFMYSMYFIPLQSFFLKLKLSHLWPIRVPLNWLFSQHSKMSQACTLPHSDLQSAFSLKSPDFFQWEWYLETKTWVLRVLIATRFSTLLGPSNVKNLWEIYVYVFLNHIEIFHSNLVIQRFHFNFFYFYTYIAFLLH